MSFDVTTLALAKSYADQHGGGGGASTAGDFIIKMTLASADDGNYTVASCDATVEQIDAAVAAEKRVVVIASINGLVFELSMLQGFQNNFYYFGMFLSGQTIIAVVQKAGENESIWQFSIGYIQSGDVDYSNDALPNISSVEDALNKLIRESHSHANKDTLDKLSASNGKLQYNRSDVGLKGDKGADGKSAYQYAQEGGYTGTETEFSEKLAQEQLTGTTNDLTPTQVYEAVSAGIPVKVQYTDSTYGLLSFTAFNIAESFNLIVSQTIIYANGVYILAELVGKIQAGNWVTMFTVLAEETDIPTVLPNPNALTFAGAVTGSYDGSAAMTVNIPNAVTDEHINSLIDTKLGVIENGSY